jgi:hypothetical protein
MLIAFSPLGSPVTYLGNQKSFDPTTGALQLTQVIVLARSKDGHLDVMKVPHAGRESTIHLNTKDVPGALVESPEDDTVKLYENHVVKAYSKLTIL